MDELARAIQFLKPTAEFSLINNDYSTIKWDVLDGDAPTQAELDAAMEQVKVKDIEDAQNRAASRQAILDRLGLTAEEAALLLG
jgi:hypothetical protein